MKKRKIEVQEELMTPSRVKNIKDIKMNMPDEPFETLNKKDNPTYNRNKEAIHCAKDIDWDNIPAGKIPQYKVYKTAAIIVDEFAETMDCSRTQAVQSLIIMGWKYHLEKQYYYDIVQKIKVDELVEKTRRRYSKGDKDYVVRIILETLTNKGLIKKKHK